MSDFIASTEIDFVSAATIAGRYSVTARHITNLATEGEIPGVKVGGTWRFDPSAVQAALVAKTFSHIRPKTSGGKSNEN